VNVSSHDIRATDLNVTLFLLHTGPLDKNPFLMMPYRAAFGWLPYVKRLIMLSGQAKIYQFEEWKRATDALKMPVVNYSSNCVT